jgi:hypothetical protein
MDSEKMEKEFLFFSNFFPLQSGNKERKKPKDKT